MSTQTTHTPLARWLFENVKTLRWIEDQTEINYPSLVNFKRGYKVQRVKTLGANGEKIVNKVKIKYSPEWRTKRDIAKLTGLDPNTVYEHRHESPDPIEEDEVTENKK